MVHGAVTCCGVTLRDVAYRQVEEAPRANSRGMARVMRRLSAARRQSVDRGRSSSTSPASPSAGALSSRSEPAKAAVAGPVTSRGDVACVVAWVGGGPHITPNGIRVNDEVSTGGEDQFTVGGGGGGGRSGGGFSWVAAGTTDGQVVVWNPMQEKPTLIASMSRGGVSTIECMVHVPSKQMLVAGTQNGKLHLIFMASPRCVWGGCCLSTRGRG